MFVAVKLSSLNDDSQTGMWQIRARIKKQIRNDAAIAGKVALQAGELERYDVPVQIVVQPYESGRKIRDAGNVMSTAKAVIDGLRDAGVIIDDGPRYVRALTFMAGKRVGSTYEGLRVTFRPWPS